MGDVLAVGVLLLWVLLWLLLWLLLWVLIECIRRERLVVHAG